VSLLQGSEGKVVGTSHGLLNNDPRMAKSMPHIHTERKGTSFIFAGCAVYVIVEQVVWIVVAVRIDNIRWHSNKVSPDFRQTNSTYYTSLMFERHAAQNCQGLGSRSRGDRLRAPEDPGADRL